ncbi:YceD family protein [Hyphomicrobium sp. D-2]|uniref:YceD family protein n=1 Tax=Hyphomicrobium sp. D-2 TaxID=3041621 RepID=UPI0024551DDB|nr:YceD family protein [Hyphomicrobium sp. D-2]MDH4982857.1 DUF177 domain-containing protein [Hyphomicrobium sp. D-2]
MTEAALLGWSYRTTQIPDGGLRESRVATEAERAAIAAELGLLACDFLDTRFSIRALGKGHYRLAGDLKARLKQSCVVTLEPLDEDVKAAFDVEYSPAQGLPQSSADEVEALSAAEIEPIERGEIDAGRIVFETLVANLNPYPRKDGAAFEGGDADDDERPAGPFDILKKLKDGA